VLDIPQFILDRKRSNVPVFTWEEVARWPPWLVDILVSDGVLEPDGHAKSFTCDSCGEGHVETVEYVESPPGSGIRAYIKCAVDGRVRVDLAKLRKWRITEKAVQATDRPANQSATISELDRDDALREQLWRAVQAGSVVGVLTVLGTDIERWANRLKDKLFDYFHGNLSQNDRLMCYRSPMRSSWLDRPLLGWDEAVEMLEFHKSVDYAKRFAERLYDLDRLRMAFADDVCEFGGKYGAEIDLPHFLVLDEARSDVFGVAAQVVQHILLLSNQLKAAPQESNSNGAIGNRSRVEGNAVRNRQSTNASQAKKSWTQSALDAAIREFKTKRSATYSDLVDGVRAGRRGAKDAAQKMFGRNAIARELCVKAPAMVSKSPEWQAIAEELRLSRNTRPGSRPQKKVGLDIALENHATVASDSAADLALQNETIRLIRSSMPQVEAEATIEKLQRGEITDDQARELVEAVIDQVRESRTRKVRSSP